MTAHLVSGKKRTPGETLVGRRHVIPRTPAPSPRSPPDPAIPRPQRPDGPAATVATVRALPCAGMFRTPDVECH